MGICQPEIPSLVREYKNMLLLSREKLLGNTEVRLLVKATAFFCAS
jgi:hypothetical protein